MNTLKIALQIPFNVLVKRMLKKMLPARSENYTQSEFRQTSFKYQLNNLLDTSQLSKATNLKSINHYLKQEFDLLGSGWINRNALPPLVLAIPHRSFSKRLIQILPKDYRLIDWQLDVKSGFRFNIQQPFDQQQIDPAKNVDIKNCWELGRLQHFPSMALAANHHPDKTEIITAFKNQSLDFILSNPIGMGVQYACAMDVGIRVCNWLVALDLFLQIDNNTILDDEFIQIVTAYLYNSTQFIMNHLEAKEGAAGNHYLFNLLGILFASSYFSETAETAAWQKFATAELKKEFFKQFFNDGGNFEGSTTYHCLSAEAILYATALMLRKGEKLEEAYIDLFNKMFQFIVDVMKPTGDMPQFGDNDSGRLFKFQEEQNLLNYTNLLNGFLGLFENKKKETISGQLVQQLANNKTIKRFSEKEKQLVLVEQFPKQLQHSKTTTVPFNSAIHLDKITSFSYEQFGIYGFKSDEFYLAISAIANPSMHHSWGHVHNDKLSFELQVHQQDLVKDPGTYSYSAFPSKRNELRGSKAHHGIIVEGIEQNKSLGLFYLEREINCEVIEMKDFSITLKACYYGVQHIRKFTIQTNQLLVEDFCSHPFKVNINCYPFYSPNYGQLNGMKKGAINE